MGSFGTRQYRVGASSHQSGPFAMQALLHALESLLSLEHLPRTGWIQHGIAPPEPLAGHILGVAYVALALAPRVDPPLDVDRVVALAVVHDAPEALTGDLSLKGSALLPEGAKEYAEERAARELFEPMNPTALARSVEFEAGETREARFAKLCDRLQLGLRLLVYVRGGHRGLGEFHSTVEALDCSEFEPAREFHGLLLEELAHFSA